MKKWQAAGLSSLLILTLSACSLNLASSGDGGTVSDQGNSPLTASEVIAQSVKAFEQVDSYTVKSEVKQALTMNTDGEVHTMTSEITTHADWIREPVRMHIISEVRTEGMLLQTIEQYYTTDEGHYSNMGGIWVKMPEREVTVETFESMPESPEGLIGMMAELENEVILTEEKGSYVLSIVLPESALTQMSEALTSSREGSQEKQPSLPQIIINSMKVNFEVSKDTYTILKMTIEQDSETGNDENAISQTKVETNSYSNFNGIESIEVPREVIEGAR